MHEHHRDAALPGRGLIPVMRPVYVKQHEAHLEGWTSTHWCTVERGNGKPTWVSETFCDRAGACRAAKNFIALLDPAIPVEFWRWVGPMSGESRLVTERIR